MIKKYGCKSAGNKNTTYSIGEWIYGIQLTGKNLSVAGFKYLGQCGKYIICCSEYEFCKNNFNKQLRIMYEESVKERGVSLNFLIKEFTFKSRKDAYDKLARLNKPNEKRIKNYKRIIKHMHSKEETVIIIENILCKLTYCKECGKVYKIKLPEISVQ
ncbi:MAG: hypothetical protein E7635_05790 [Ruminococcaceae bacterium]|nr:hypothetical protein [Oscillospiraceae bacterium]